MGGGLCTADLAGTGLVGVYNLSVDATDLNLLREMVEVEGGEE